MTTKMIAKCSDLLGEPVIAAAMVVPPGATLYKSYAPKSKSLAIGGPIAAAIMSKQANQDAGQAGTVPRQMGVLAVTESEAVYFKKKTVGSSPASVIARWPRSDIAFEFEDNGTWSYPGLSMSFTDGSSCAVFGEKKWGLDTLAAAS